MSLSVRNPKGAGRKKKFSQEQVIDAVDKYILYNEIDGISASKVAKYAQTKLGYAGMEYYHITQYAEANNKIEEQKNKKKLAFIVDESLIWPNTSIDTLAEKLIKNPNCIKNYLLDMRNLHKASYEKIAQLSEENRKMKKELSEHRNKDDSEKRRIREVLQVNKELIEKADMLRKLIDFEKQIKMCKYVWEHTLIEPNSLAEQYIKSLLYCGVISASDVEKITNTSITPKKKNELVNSEGVTNIFRHAVKDIETELSEDELDIPSDENDTSVSVDDLRDLLGIKK